MRKGGAGGDTEEWQAMNAQLERVMQQAAAVKLEAGSRVDSFLVDFGASHSDESRAEAAQRAQRAQLAAMQQKVCSI